jgi:outer membrane protein assembly factor BamB/tRNA A-37 threonylcarbamoyl transferase component Bud32
LVQQGFKREFQLETKRTTKSIQVGEEKRGPDKHLKPGTTLVGRYLVQDIAGVGGMGAVYRARDLHFPKVIKLVAVKEMVNQARDPLIRKTIVQNFEREANVLATLHHKSVPRIYDYFHDDDRSYLVMEFIHGKDMEKVLTENEDFLSEEQIITWGIELCDVLGYLHTHEPDPVIFRDMKPSNAMVDVNNHIILVDYGIAKHFEANQKGTMIGTEGYSPPEQYRGEASPQADIYALGATLHHLLTRRDPRLEAPFSFSERPIRSINPSISMELETVVNTALQYNPEDRFSSADAMKEALMAVARKTGALRRMSIPSVSLVQAGTIKPLWTFECEDEVRGTPAYYNGSILVGCYDNNLYAIDASDGKFLWKYPTEAGIVSKPAVIDDNVYFGSEDSRLHVVSSRSGKVVWTYYTDAPIRSSPRIAEGHVFVGSDDGFLHAVNMITGRRSWRVEAGSPIRSTPFVANELIYFGSESGEFFCVDYRGELKWRFRAKRAITSSPVVAEGIVYFGSVDWTLYAMDAEIGFVVWRFRMGKGSISSPSIVDDFLFTGSADGFIYCLNIHSGKEVWRYQTDHQVTGSPVVYKDSIYCGSVDSNLYCLEARTGRQRWTFGTEGPVTSTPIVYDDIVYLSSTDHKVYALLA